MWETLFSSRSLCLLLEPLPGCVSLGSDRQQLIPGNTRARGPNAIYQVSPWAWKGSYQSVKHRTRPPLSIGVNSLSLLSSSSFFLFPSSSRISTRGIPKTSTTCSPLGGERGRGGTPRPRPGWGPGLLGAPGSGHQPHGPGARTPEEPYGPLGSLNAFTLSSGQLGSRARLHLLFKRLPPTQHNTPAQPPCWESSSQTYSSLGCGSAVHYRSKAWGRPENVMLSMKTLVHNRTWWPEQRWAEQWWDNVRLELRRDGGCKWVVSS